MGSRLGKQKGRRIILKRQQRNKEDPYDEERKQPALGGCRNWHPQGEPGFRMNKTVKGTAGEAEDSRDFIDDGL